MEFWKYGEYGVVMGMGELEMILFIRRFLLLVFLFSISRGEDA